jgi:hypothetical protein
MPGKSRSRLAGNCKVEGEPSATLRMGDLGLDQDGIRSIHRIAKQVQVCGRRDSHDAPDLETRRA